MDRLAGRIIFAAVSALALSACGGGSSGEIASTPNPIPSPPPAPKPKNTNVADLRYSETIATIDAHHLATFDLTSSTTMSSEAREGELTFAYDAATKAYVVSARGRSMEFGQNDILSDVEGETIYAKFDDEGTERLTLTNVGYGSGLETSSVGLGYWQSNAGSEGKQDTEFDVFVYGFPTMASSVPRVGSASYAVDVFGFATPVDKVPFGILAPGTMLVDFGNANFTIEAEARELSLVTGAITTSTSFLAAGQLSSAGGLDGTFVYEHSSDYMSGTLSGSFFGTSAGEVGGAFQGGGRDGSAVSGAFTGSHSSSSASSMTLADLGPDARMAGYTARLKTLRDPVSGHAGFVSAEIGGLGIDLTDAEFWVPPTRDAFFISANRKSTAGDFVTYERTLDGSTHTLSLLKPSGNGMIELTYSTFAERSVASEGLNTDVLETSFTAAGIPPPHGTLAARTGTATYSGIALGKAGDASRTLDVTGTSHFEIDFSNEGYGGWLKLKGVDQANGSTVDFGQLNIASGTGFFGEGFRGNFDVSAGSDIRMRFFGPTGEELSGAFAAHVADFSIAGAVLSKRD